MKKLLSINTRLFFGFTALGFFLLVLYSCSPKAKGIPAGDKNESTNTNPRAIEHHAPNQARIDSIKAAKAKERNQN